MALQSKGSLQYFPLRLMTTTTLTYGVLLLFLAFDDRGVGGSGHDEDRKKVQSSMKPVDSFTEEQMDSLEFAEFCELGLLERQVGHHLQDDVKLAECSVTVAGEFDIEIDGKMLFTLIAIITWGAIIRAVIHRFELKIPYTVVVMLSGLAVGFLSRRFCPQMNEYTAIARISSKLILFTFLPLLIFESAFSIPVHTFRRSAIQIIIVAFPGMVLCTFFAAGVCYHYFKSYQWTFMEATLFGSIVSATDPVAVVAILRELGVSEILSVMIEGESLLNDGVAILLYEIFEHIAVNEEKGIEKPTGVVVLDSFIQFVQIAIGGPIFGWIMGKITIFLMKYVFNDAPVEISATIVAAYLTYWLSEDVLHTSGVMAVVLLGLTLRAERTVISPDSEESVHHFWSIMGYLANTVLFELVGIVIAETALNDIELNDFWNLILLYIAIHVSRFLMLTLFYPILARIGYGMTWQNMIVMMWGGLRGAVGICLALDVYRTEPFCEDRLVGSKILFHTAGIVLLTLCVNGTTTRPLLTALRLTEVSLGRKEDMNNATKRIQRLKGQAIRTFQLSPRMFDADWVLVDGFCTVKNPYKTVKLHIVAKKKSRETAAVDNIHPPEPVRDNATICTTCLTLIPNDPTSEAYYHLTEEARLKVIRAMKVSYTHRNSIGLVLDNSLQILMGDAERKEDKPLQLICASDFNRYTKTRGCYPWLADKILKLEKRESKKPPKPAAKWRAPFWRAVCHPSFDTTFLIIVVVNLIPVLWEVIEFTTQKQYSCEELRASQKFQAFIILNIIFTIIFTVEFLINILGRTMKDYFSDFWTYLDVSVLILCYVDIFLHYLQRCQNDNSFVRLGRIFRLLRFVRALRLLKPTLPKLKASIHKKIDIQIFVGLDITRGFVFASEEVHRFLPQMIENKRVFKEIKDHMEHERAEGLKIIAMLQQQHPGIAIALKTRHACRMVINVMSDELVDAKDEGLLDTTEVDVLTRILELKIKRLWNSPVSHEPFTSQVLLANLTWIEHSDELYDEILGTAQLVSYGFGDYICQAGEETSGVYVIVAGMIKVSYTPSPTLVELRNNFGKLPNSEIYTDLTFSEPETDYFSAGFVFGEYGVLTGDRWASDIVAETSLVVYHISKDVIKAAIKKYTGYNPLEGQVWRSIALRRATGLLEQLPRYQSSLDTIPIVLQRSTVVINDLLNVFDIAPYVSEVVIIEGYATNQDTNDTYIAPFVVPRTCTKLVRMPNPQTVNRILILADEDVDLSTPRSDGRTSGEYRRNINW